MNEPSEFYKDEFWPGWREQEAEMVRKFKEAIAPRQQETPCGECNLQPRERCDVCGAKQA